jgi:ABC-type transport system substrate-binding protein
MQRWQRRVLAGCCVLGLAVTLVCAQTASSPAKPKLDRLKIAVAPLGFDSNLTWSHTISGLLDKRPVLEFLVGVDRYTGQYIPELAEKWDMAPDGKTWTIQLRQGIQFHENWGEFTARDVRHAVFLITQPDAAASGTTFWRGVMGVTKTDTLEDVMDITPSGRTMPLDRHIPSCSHYSLGIPPWA